MNNKYKPEKLQNLVSLFDDVININTSTKLEIRDPKKIVNYKNYKQIKIESAKYLELDTNKNIQLYKEWNILSEVAVYFNTFPFKKTEDTAIYNDIEAKIKEDRFISLKEFIYYFFKNPEIITSQLTTKEVITYYLKIQRLLFKHLLYAYVMTIPPEDDIDYFRSIVEFNNINLNLLFINKKDSFLYNLNNGIKEATKNLTILTAERLYYINGKENNQASTFRNAAKNFISHYFSTNEKKEFIRKHKDKRYSIYTDDNYIANMFSEVFYNDEAMLLYFQNEQQYKQINMYTCEFFSYMHASIIQKANEFKRPTTEALVLLVNDAKHISKYCKTKIITQKDNEIEEPTKFISLPKYFFSEDTAKKYLENKNEKKFTGISNRQYSLLIEAFNIMHRNCIAEFYKIFTEGERLKKFKV